MWGVCALAGRVAAGLGDGVVDGVCGIGGGIMFFGVGCGVGEWLVVSSCVCPSGGFVVGVWFEVAVFLFSVGAGCGLVGVSSRRGGDFW